jgi:Pyrimidine dimer DNA glycosylase
MRLWSLHPSLLDRVGLVALWREALLAQKVLAGATKGYRRHPQLDRFRQSGQPVRAIASYLWSVADEAKERGYLFDVSKIAMRRGSFTILVTRGQLAYEFTHLKKKLRQRDPKRLQLVDRKPVKVNSTFQVVDGPIEPWERVQPGAVHGRGQKRLEVDSSTD